MFAVAVGLAPLHPVSSTSEKEQYVNFDGLCLAKRYFTAESCRRLRIFCAPEPYCNTYCWITTIYDQSPKHNDLIQAPRGGFSGPAMGFNNLPVADMAPITIMGHKAYGVFIEPGMGLRQNDAKGTAVDDQAGGQYWVISGHHYNSGCCFDYGNATAWYRGIPPGPWIMTDQENNLVGCVNPDGSKFCKDLPCITWRFVTAPADGEPHHWRSMGGDAQRGGLNVIIDGPRVNATYDPMRKQGAILLGNGGDTNIKVSSVANISVGDKIRLDIDSVGHGIETVTVTRVGTQSARNTFAGPLKDSDKGTGLDLAVPLKFNHTANLPFSAWGTGISFKPATAFAHSSNEPVQPLGAGITLDQPLANNHPIDAVVRYEKVTTAGYQGAQKPNQWFGGPALANAGNMVLRDAAGLVVDSPNYGGLVDPWAAEGYQAESGSGKSGCSVPAPGGGRGGFGGRGGSPASTPHRSAGRFPDGIDADSNCTDFLLQSAGALAAASAAGANNIKVASVADFDAGQTIRIDTGANLESAVIATVGTPGATTTGAATAVGATVIPVAGGMGFSAGQTITIDGGANQETAVIASTGRGGGAGRGGPGGGATITVAAPLKSAHEAGAQVSGTGITLTAALTRAHDSGAQVAGNVPTPGAPNQYYRKGLRAKR